MERATAMHQEQRPAPAAEADRRGGQAAPAFSDQRRSAAQLATLASAANASAQVASLRDASAMMNHGGGGAAIAQLKKDAALATIRTKKANGGNSTGTKVVKTKGGAFGIFQYPMNGKIIDKFSGANMAQDSDKDTEAAKKYGATKMEIPTAVADHDLAVTKNSVTGLSETVIKSDDRPAHFSHADKANGRTAKDREDQYTWHHKQSFGHMELVDMNVHGAMWHYGGIDGWEASLHKSDAGDDDVSAATSDDE